MATIRKRGAVWYVKYYDANRRQRMVRGYSDRRETEALANRLEAEKHAIRRGDIDPKAERRKVERAKPIDIHLAAFRDTLASRGSNTHYVATTVRDVERFISHAEVKHASAVERTMVDRWVLSLRRPYRVKLKSGKEVERTHAHRTVNRHIKSLQGFLSFLHSDGATPEYVLSKYPLLPEKGHEKRRRRALTVAEQALLLKHADASRVDFYRFALLTGCRLIQLQTLRVRDIDFRAGVVNLKSKKKGGTHIVPMNAELIPVLRGRCKLKLRDALVFPDAPTKDQAADWLRSDLEAAGVDTTEVDFHALRHTFGTTLALRGVHPTALQALMGHANIETTLGYYVHMQRDDLRAAVALMSA